MFPMDYIPFIFSIEPLRHTLLYDSCFLFGFPLSLSSLLPY